MVDGFSSADPRLARGPQVAAKPRKRSSSRRRTSTVRISRDTVFIDGRGFSVAPSLQAAFIRSKTGGSGSSARAAIAEATRKADAARAAAEAFSKRKASEAAARTKRAIDAARKASRRGITTGEVQAIERKQGFISRKIQQLEDLQKIRSTKSIRTKQKNLENELALLGITVGETVVKGVVALVTLPKTLINVAKNPSQLKKIPSAIRRGGSEFGQLIRVSPTEAFAKIGGEILFLKGTGDALKVVGEVGNKASARLNPKFRAVKGGKLTIKVKDIGQKPKLDFTKKPREVTIRVGGPVSKIAEPLAKQARRAGKRVTAVSAQADKLVNLIRTKRIVRKPIPNEANLPLRTKKLLRRFDQGRITRAQLIRLQKEVPILERSFFADPKGRFRPSRLGAKQKDASLLDILSGDVTFRASKPQILVFENVKVAKFPKNLKDVEKALKTGRTLTQSQARRLLNFQTKKTGQFKPIGALTKEPEITLAPGEIIKKVKKVGVTIINGKKVEIVQARVVRTKPATKKLIQKARSGKLTAKELKTLRAKIKKETGFDPLIGRRKGPRPRARLPKRVPGRPKKRVTRKKAKRPTKRKPVIRRKPVKRKPAKRPTKRKPARAVRPTKRAPRKAPKRPVRRRVVRKPARAPKPVPRKRAKRKRVVRKRKTAKSYNVFARPVKRRKGQKRPKLVKVNKVPLKKSRAKDVRNYISDTSLARTARIKPAKGKPKKSRLKVPKGYAKKSSKKFRRHKIVKGKRKPLPKGKVIEKRRNLLDTRQEKRKIGLRKRIKQITRKPKKRKKVRKPIRRKVSRKPKRTRKTMTKRRKKR